MTGTQIVFIFVLAAIAIIMLFNGGDGGEYGGYA